MRSVVAVDKRRTLAARGVAAGAVGLAAVAGQAAVAAPARAADGQAPQVRCTP